MPPSMFTTQKFKRVTLCKFQFHFYNRGKLYSTTCCITPFTIKVFPFLLPCVYASLSIYHRRIFALRMSLSRLKKEDIRIVHCHAFYDDETRIFVSSRQTEQKVCSLKNQPISEKKSFPLISYYLRKSDSLCRMKIQKNNIRN